MGIFNWFKKKAGVLVLAGAAIGGIELHSRLMDNIAVASKQLGGAEVTVRHIKRYVSNCSIETSKISEAAGLLTDAEIAKQLGDTDTAMKYCDIALNILTSIPFDILERDLVSIQDEIIRNPALRQVFTHEVNQAVAQMNGIIKQYESIRNYALKLKSSLK